ncbi:MAG TPA: hypothetical protein VNR39_18305 [Pseudolabrys sp.]|nr:hypothetical protein [Pseudolabrys sp.]
MTQFERGVPAITFAMIVTWLAFASVPLWIEKVGLYQYLGVEILIFATYALAYNLVLGHAGLPSFGHGAFFGIGAYAFGLAQHHAGRTCGFASLQRRLRQRSLASLWHSSSRTGGASITR